MIAEAPETAESGGGWCDYFVHRQRDLRGPRGGSKRREKVRWSVRLRSRSRSRSCSSSLAVLMTEARTLESLLSRVHQKAETRTSEIHSGGVVRGGENSFLAEGRRLLLLRWWWWLSFLRSRKVLLGLGNPGLVSAVCIRSKMEGWKENGVER